MQRAHCDSSKEDITLGGPESVLWNQNQQELEKKQFLYGVLVFFSGEFTGLAGGYRNDFSGKPDGARANNYPYEICKSNVSIPGL